MSELELFQFEGAEVRIVMLDGEPWLVAKDLCDALGLGNSTMALTRLDGPDLSTIEVRSGGQRRKMKIVNEFGANDLILDSRKPNARRLRHKITHEVMPALRRTGSYSEVTVEQPALPMNYEEALEHLLIKTRELRAANEQIEEVTHQVEMLEPKAERHDAWMDETYGVHVRQAAKMLAQEGLLPGVGSEKFLWDFLRRIKWVTRIGKSWTAVPTQMRMSRLREHFGMGYLNTYGQHQPGRPTVLITPEGMIALRQIMVNMHGGGTSVRAIGS